MDIERLVSEVYRTLLAREPDGGGLEYWSGKIAEGMSIPAFRQAVLGSPEHALVRADGRVTADAPFIALHHSRMAMVRQLPSVARILDLGGGAIGDPRGALIAMGYSHQFEALHIIEPPPQERHEIYKDIPDIAQVVSTEFGQVTYHYGSMADLSRFEDGYFDLVFSGETIEHVSVDDCKKTLREVRRVLAPNGEFCFDTPNRAITEIYLPDGYLNPEHKIEYRHSEMANLLTEARLHCVDILGITHMPETYEKKAFLLSEMLQNIGLHPDYERSFLLYYRCVRG